MELSAYELLAQIAKYWFLALAFFILARMILSVRREIRIEKEVQREIRQEGTAVNATLVLLSDENRKLRRGKLFPVEGETTVGRARRCDICLNAPSLQSVHCILNWEKNGMTVVPVGSAFVSLNGKVIQQRALAEDGDELQIGGLLFLLRLEENENAQS